MLQCSTFVYTQAGRGPYDTPMIRRIASVYLREIIMRVSVRKRGVRRIMGSNDSSLLIYFTLA